MHFCDGCNEQVGRSGASVLASGGEGSLVAVRRQLYAYVDREMRKPLELVLQRDVIGAAAGREEQLEAHRRAEPDLIGLDQFCPPATETATSVPGARVREIPDHLTEFAAGAVPPGPARCLRPSECGPGASGDARG
jgi:hypothetical protein